MGIQGEGGGDTVRRRRGYREREEEEGYRERERGCELEGLMGRSRNGEEAGGCEAREGKREDE